ncbi:MAG TPA: transglycosylase domain-containing protein [Cellulomonas sp.]
MSSRPRSRGHAGRAARATGHAAQGVALLVSFVLMAGIGGVLAAGLALPAVALANSATNVTTEAFNDLPTDLNLTTLPQKSVILAADGTQLATFYDENRVIVSLADIAPIMQKAVISVEDKRFYEHSGIDPQGMLRAFATGALGGETQGASTLTQQYIKNVQIQAAQTIDDPVQRQAAVDAATADQGTEGYARKLREAKLAIALEKRWSKDQILEAYLNIAQFGARSIYGVEAAAQYYFSTDAKDLNYLQAATIAGITQSPTKWDPQLHPAQSQGRRNTVLETMHDQGYITDAQYQTGVATPIASTLKPSEVQQGCMVADKAVPGSGYFCDYVTKVVLNDPAFGADQKTRQQLLYRGGLTITTTLVPSQQALALASVDAHVPKDDPSGIGASMVTVEPGTGKITAMAQNRDYTALPDAQPGQTSVNWNTSKPYGGSAGFAPGSTFKPFTLVEWLKTGHSLSETFDGTLRPIPYADFTACGAPYGNKGVYTFGNSEGAGGVMNAIAATKNSVNSAYLAMATQVDLCNVMQDAADLGVVQPSGKDIGKNIAARPANVIGSDNVTPLAMAGAFAAFAANGTFCQPIAITRVVGPDGKDLPVPSANCQEKLEPRIASAVNYTLKNVWQGTAKALGQPSYPAAGKTGTTTYSENLWFVGYTPTLAAAVWVGHPDTFTTMHGLTIHGIPYTKRSSGPFGADIPGPIWRQFMDQFMAGQNVPDFPAAGTKEIYGEQVNVPSVVGMAQADATNALQGAGFQVKVAAAQATDYHPAGTVVAQSSTGTAPKNSIITITLSNGQGAPPAPTCIPGGQWDPGCGPQPGATATSQGQIPGAGFPFPGNGNNGNGPGGNH